MPKQKYSRDDNGYFQTKVWDGTYLEGGKKRYVTLRSTKSSADLEKKVEKIKDEIKKNGAVIESSISLYEYAKHWRKTYKNQKEAATKGMYDQQIEKYLKQFSDVTPKEIKKSQIQELFTENASKPRTCQILKQILDQVFQAAADDHMITRQAAIDLMRNLDIPSYKAKERRPLTKEEIKAINKASYTVYEKAFVFVLFGCGLRREEALALTRFNVDFKNGYIKVTNAVGYDRKGVPYLKSPKSKRGEREVPMPKCTQDALKARISDLSDTDKYLFPMMTNGSQKSSKGDLMTKDAYSDFWDGIRAKTNAAMGAKNGVWLCKDLTAHIFRHNYCSALCQKVPAISINEIAALLGDTPEMVLRVYSHVMKEKEDTKAVVLDTVDKLLCNV